MSEHHIQEIASRMDVGVGCARRLAKAVKAAISNVAMTVYTVDRDAKFDVIGILVSLGMLRLRAGTYRCDIMSATLRGVAAKVRLSAAHSEYGSQRSGFNPQLQTWLLQCRKTDQ